MEQGTSFEKWLLLLLFLVCAFCYCCTHAGMADTSLFFVTFRRRKDLFQVLAPLPWNSIGTIATLSQEIIYILSCPVATKFNSCTIKSTLQRSCSSSVCSLSP
ncbi:uncharacterized protein LOC115749935 isoform X2 [Rhodamnia argentea]|nr:uncharacterized protein LOC115749935 isoform X2 [Rhodamnia argentea]